MIADVATGSEAAFSKLYDRHSPSLFALVHRILNDRRESEDVIQEGFVQIWRQARDYNPARGSVFTWAVVILRHRAIDRVRARGRRDRLAQTAAAETEADMAQDSAEHYLREERAVVRRALASISDQERQAIELAYFGGLTQEQISQSTGEPLGTVKARIRRGLIKLRGFLQGRL